MRRERRQEALSRSLDCETASSGASPDHAPPSWDWPDPRAQAPFDNLAHRELVAAIAGRLTERPRQVLGLLLAGQGRAEIGAALRLSRQMVHDHICSIRRAALAELPDLDASLESKG
jgi:DNA-binding NarL/FixJ family response regulator